MFPPQLTDTTILAINSSGDNLIKLKDMNIRTFKL